MLISPMRHSCHVSKESLLTRCTRGAKAFEHLCKIARKGVNTRAGALQTIRTDLRQRRRLGTVQSIAICLEGFKICMAVTKPKVLLTTPFWIRYTTAVVSSSSRETLTQLTTLNRKPLSASSNRSGLSVKMSTYWTDRSTQTRLRTEKQEYQDRPAKRHIGLYPCRKCRIHDIILFNPFFFSF